MQDLCDNRRRKIGYTCVYPNAKLLPMKDAAIRIRVERELRTSFLEACRTTERQASDVLREFMQAYVERYLGGQGDLFPSKKPAKKPVPRGLPHDC